MKTEHDLRIAIPSTDEVRGLRYVVPSVELGWGLSLRTIPEMVFPTWRIDVVL